MRELWRWLAKVAVLAVFFGFWSLLVTYCMDHVVGAFGGPRTDVSFNSLGHAIIGVLAPRSWILATIAVWVLVQVGVLP